MMDKLITSIINHPLVLIILKILSYIIIPVSDIVTTHDKSTKTTVTSPKIKQIDQANDKLVDDDDQGEQPPSDLFPSIERVKSLKSSVKPCSTGVSTKYLPIKNEFGEIVEWTFTDDGSFDNLSINSEMMMANPSSHPMNVNMDMNQFNLNQYNLNQYNINQYNTNQVDMNQINNDLNLNMNQVPMTNQVPLNAMNMTMNLNQNMNINQAINEIGECISPITSNSSSTSFDDKITKPLTPNSSTDEKSHQCPHCEATFKLRGYLTRHLKKHSVKKAYSCPFHKFLAHIDENNITHKCHPTGGFSRRDTYKTHLKLRHFSYPKGTVTKERSKSSGNCSMCGEFFPNSEIWCEIHIEGGECKHLPVGFKGKSRIKNRLKKQLKKAGMNEEEFFNNLNNLSPESQTNELTDFQQLAQHRQRYQSPVQEQDQPSQQQLPQIQQQPTPQPQPHYQHSGNQTSHYSQYQQSTPPTSNAQPVKIPVQVPVHQPIPVSVKEESLNSSTNSLPNSTFSQSNPVSSPYYSSTQSTPVHQVKPKLPNDLDFFNILDYDDEFCLDLDQRPNMINNNPMVLNNNNNNTQNNNNMYNNQLQLNQYQMNLMNNQIPMNLNLSQDHQVSHQPQQQYPQHSYPSHQPAIHHPYQQYQHYQAYPHFDEVDDQLHVQVHTF